MAMRKTTVEDLNAYQEKHNYMRHCGICARNYYESLVGPCPRREGRQVCMYCCRLCREHYRSFIGQGCRVKDREREEHQKGINR